MLSRKHEWQSHVSPLFLGAGTAAGCAEVCDRVGWAEGGAKDCARLKSCTNGLWGIVKKRRTWYP